MILLLPFTIALLAGVFCGVLGYYVERLGIVTLSFSVAHAALAGAAIGMVIGADITLTAAALALGFAALMGVAASRASWARELISMAFFSFFNALAIFMVYLSNTLVLATTTLAAVLWGSVLAVTPFKAAVLASALALFTFYVVAYKHHLDSLLFDRKLAEAEGVDVQAHTLVMLLFVAACIALTLKLTGGFLVFALLYNPMAAAMQLSRRAHVQQVLSPALGALSAVGGLATSYLMDWPVGACIALFSSAILLVAVAVRLVLNALLARRAAGHATPPPASCAGPRRR